MQNLSASPYGYGKDLANWSNHSAKISMEYQLNARWSASASARIYWGYPGGQDLADYNMEQLGGRLGAPQYDESTRAFEESVYLNLGLEYRFGQGNTVRLDAFNLMGIVDDDYNNRNYFQRTSQYREEIAAIAVTVNYKFGE
ncbi:MAG: hypothetical protein HOC23_13785 [Halieaceae bacterium]|jgi:outer membrane receptor for ferrienterochelin and colicins|nr:hypothetical protein [Halieaceae bacterium]